jgi:hypothetical protein
LRKQANFGKAVENDTVGLRLLKRLEYALGRLTQLQVRGIQEALLLVRIQQTLGRDELENFDIVEHPAMRRSTGPQFIVGLGQCYVEATLPGSRPSQQELCRNGGLAGTGLALKKKDPSAREPASQDVIEAANPGGGGAF